MSASATVPAAAAAATAAGLVPIVGRPMKLLFCGLEFPDGARCTAAALAGCPDEDGIRVVTCAREDVAREIVDADMAVPLMTRLDAATIAKGERLRLVLQFGVGLEGVDRAACSARGVALARIPSERTGNAASTAEMAVYLLLAAMRRHEQLASSLASRTLGAPLGRQLKGSRVLIVGWGHIAREVAVRLAPFGVELRAVRRSPWDDERASDADDVSAGGRRDVDAGEEDAVAALLVGKGVASTDLTAMLGDADAVVLACKQTAENRGMVDDAFLAAMAPGAVLVNVARGGLFDRDALARALESGHLGYLASDVVRGGEGRGRGDKSAMLAPALTPCPARQNTNGAGKVHLYETRTSAPVPPLGAKKKMKMNTACDVVTLRHRRHCTSTDFISGVVRTLQAISMQ